MKLFLDASGISSFDRCREFYRRGHVSQAIMGEEYPNGLNEITESIHYRWGSGAHAFVQGFWSGIESQNDLTDIWYLVCQGGPCKCGGKPDCFLCEGKQVVDGLDVRSLNPDTATKWKHLLNAVPDMVGKYLESVVYEPERMLMLEKEWQYPYLVSGDIEVILCGRIDRVMAGPSLVDVKTASEIGGAKWKTNYREEKLLEFQFGLYDWYLRKIDMAPREVRLEVMIKPYPCSAHKEIGYQEDCDSKKYKCKPPRIEDVYLNEIITDHYRKRFEQQLAFKVEEISRYYRNYSEQRPWPLNSNACISRYGGARCEFMDLCMFGESEKTMAPFKKRESHLQLVRLG